MSRTQKKEFTPLEFYQAYPSADLIPIEAPTAAMTWAEMMVRADDCGDSLFTLLVHEIGEAYRDESDAEVAYDVVRGRFKQILADLNAVMLAHARTAQVLRVSK